MLKLMFQALRTFEQLVSGNSVSSVLRFFRVLCQFAWLGYKVS
jgi:hypothetical protein